MSKQGYEEKIRSLLNNGASSASRGAAFLRRIDEQRSSFVSIPLDHLSRYLAPLLPGTLTSIVGPSHNGKSLLMKELAYATAAQFAAAGRDEMVVWIDTETPIEILALGQMVNHANLSMVDVMENSQKYQSRKKAILDSSIRLAQNGITYIAPSLDNDLPPLTLSNIHRGLTMLKEGQYDGKQRKIGVIFLDYLQALPYDEEVQKVPGDGQRRIQVMRDVERLRQMAVQFSCPVIMAVQSKAINDITYKIGNTWIKDKSAYAAGARGQMTIPGPYDGQESSFIFQRSDFAMAHVMPVRLQDFYAGCTFRWGTPPWEIPITPGTFVLQVHKQRVDGYPAGGVFIYDVDFGKPSGERYSFVWSSEYDPRGGL